MTLSFRSCSRSGASEEEINALPSVVCVETSISSSAQGDSNLPGESLEYLQQQQTQEDHDEEFKEHNCSTAGPLQVSVPLRTVQLAGEPCGICLSEFTAGENLRSVDGLHFFHTGCISEWLRIRAACPTCRLPLKGVSGQSWRNVTS